MTEVIKCGCNWRRLLYMLTVLIGLSIFLSLTLYGQTTSKSLGSERAPITLQVVTDFECPHCAEYYLNTLRPMIRDYVSKEKVQLTFVITASPDRPVGYSAALFANAAARCGKLGKVAEALFENQRTWMETGDVEAVVANVLTADELKKVKEEMRNKINLPVDSDLALARNLGIRSTPTTIITHRGKSVPVVGAVSYAILQTYLERLLKES